MKVNLSVDERGNVRMLYPGGVIPTHLASSPWHLNQDSVRNRTSNCSSITKYSRSVLTNDCALKQEILINEGAPGEWGEGQWKGQCHVPELIMLDHLKRLIMDRVSLMAVVIHGILITQRLLFHCPSPPLRVRLRVKQNPISRDISEQQGQGSSEQAFDLRIIPSILPVRRLNRFSFFVCNTCLSYSALLVSFWELWISSTFFLLL